MNSFTQNDCPEMETPNHPEPIPRGKKSVGEHRGGGEDRVSLVDEFKEFKKKNFKNPIHKQLARERVKKQSKRIKNLGRGGWKDDTRGRQDL